MPKYCQSCGKANPLEANFCGSCGHRFPAAAGPTPAGTRTEPGGSFQFTSAEWQNLSAEGERRQVTVLRSDLSDYSALFEALDPELVHEILEPIKAIATEVIGGRGGLVTQFRGDEIIALFGAVVSENDARDAVQAALDLHERVTQFSRQPANKLGKQLMLQTGISTGLVVIQPTQSRDGLFAISGDAINTAARLAAIAGPNEVLIGPSTRRWIEPFFSLEQLAPVLVKGRNEPITPYRVVSAYSERSLFEGRVLRGLSGFVGR